MRELRNLQSIRGYNQIKQNKVLKLAKGILIILLGLSILIIILFQYLKVKNLTFDEYITGILSIKFEDGTLVNIEDKTIYLSDKLPVALVSKISEWAEEKYIIVSYSEEIEDSKKHVISDKNNGDYDLAWKKYYVFVVSQESPINNISLEQTESLALGNIIEINGASGELIISSDSKPFLNQLFDIGVSVPSSSNIITEVSKDPTKIGFISFDDIKPDVKVISFDGNYLYSDFKEEEYPFIEKVWVKDKESINLFEKVREFLGPVNFDSDSITSIIITGTSVMGARGEYLISVEKEDPIFPIRKVSDVLKNADISHVSNEAPFFEGCAQYPHNMVFCGTLESFDAFKYAGIDVVGLTGNHVLDYGNTRFLDTLELFEKNGIQYFGGGKDYDDAHTPAIVEKNGIKFAFLGYNIIPPVSSFATNNKPGSAELELNQMIEDIEKTSLISDFILIDMQWGNEYERYPLDYQIEYGRAAIDAGANIVTGVHPHWIQKLEYYGNGVIFYGIGNFLFDQTWSQETREGIMVKHYFIEDRYLGFELIPTIISDEYQPYLATGVDIERIISYLF